MTVLNRFAGGDRGVRFLGSRGPGGGLRLRGFGAPGRRLRLRGLCWGVAGVVALVSAPGAFGQSGPVWSYGECVEYAREHNTGLLQSLLDVQTAEQNIEAAKGQWEPTLDFGTAHSFSNAPWGEGKKNSFGGNFNLNAAWSVYDGGVRSNTIRLNETQREINDLAVTNIVRDIKTQILTTYLNILYSAESVGIYSNALELSTAQTERARLLMESGKLSRVDYAQIEAQREQDRYNLTNAQSQLATRKLELKKILQLGLGENIDVAPVDIDSLGFFGDLPPMAETYDLAAGLDPQLQSLALQESQSDLNIKIAKAGRLPRIGLTAGVGTSYFVPGGNFGTQLRNALGEQIGVSLSLPIFDQRKTKTAVAKAKLDKQSVGLSMSERELDLSQTIESWYLNATESRSKYIAAESQEQSAALSNELINEKFAIGLVNPVELLTAHNNLLDARHSTLQAKYMAILALKMIEFYRTSEITLPS